MFLGEANATFMFNANGTQRADYREKAVKHKPCRPIFKVQTNPKVPEGMEK